MPAARVSVVVRCRDKASTIEHTLRALRAQSVPVEVVVVDSGSTDGTVERAAPLADVLVQVPSADFTYGGALNAGAAAASTAVHAACSAHTVPRPDFAERVLAHLSDPGIAAASGALLSPAGELLTEPYLQRRGDLEVAPWWGFSNTLSAWRAEVWADQRFREGLSACEDKEWSWRVLRLGHAIIIDPALLPLNEHRRAEGVVRNWQRVHT